MSLDHVTTIISAYVSNNPVRVDELDKLIRSVHETLKTLDIDVDKPEPAVPVAQSVFKNRLVCLEDGQSTVLLARYLKRHHNMTPEEYKEKWGLPDDYPMVAEAYSKERSKIARAQGLGKRS